MNKLDQKLARILVKRIASAITTAKYYPVVAHDPEAMARDVVRPYLETNDGTADRNTKARLR